MRKFVNGMAWWRHVGKKLKVTSAKDTDAREDLLLSYTYMDQNRKKKIQSVNKVLGDINTRLKNASDYSYSI